MPVVDLSEAFDIGEILQSPSAVDRWFLTIHERASVTTAIKKVYGMKDNNDNMHKEATKARV